MPAATTTLTGLDIQGNSDCLRPDRRPADVGEVKGQVPRRLWA
jgi:hypothetical protein